MKFALRWCVVPLLATTLLAQSATRVKSKKTASKTPAVTAEDIQALRDALAAQGQQIQQLRQELQQKDAAWQQAQQQLQQAQSTATDAQQKAASAETASSEQKDTVSKLSSDVTDIKTTLTNTAANTIDEQKKFSALESAVGHLKFSGDLRLRFEPFFGGGPSNATTSPEARLRERFRLRFNVTSKITNDFTAGFSVASGDLGDPVSTNSTETGFFTRKPLAIDKAYGVYNPHYLKPFTLTVGKFGYTWQRTELTWDNDLNPEGASAAVDYNWKGGFLNHLAVIAYGTPIFESGGGPDTFMAGGQLQTGWTLVPKVKFTADVGYYDFQNADAIAQDQVGGNGLATQGTGTSGGGNFGFSASKQTNNVGVINGKQTFASQWGIVDALARIDIDTGHKRWPIYALFNFVQNTKACENLAVFVAAGVTPPTCNAKDRHGYWTEFKVGQTKNKGDLLLGYTFARIERDAVLSAFDFSDLQQPTNVIEHRIEAYYQAYPHVQMGVTGLFGRPIVNAQALTLQNWLKRWQFDTIFSF